MIAIRPSPVTLVEISSFLVTDVCMKPRILSLYASGMNNSFAVIKSDLLKSLVPSSFSLPKMHLIIYHRRLIPVRLLKSFWKNLHSLH